MSLGEEARKYVVDALLIPLGYEQITGLSSVKTLSPPQGARLAIIQTVNQAIRWRPDGVSPDASTGMVLGAGLDFPYPGDLASFRMIEMAVSAEVNVAYFK